VKFAVEQGADEIDMVISRGRFLAGEYRYAFDEISAVKAACGLAHRKVILETGEFASLDNVRKASDPAMNASADFIKTCTGKTQPAATLSVAPGVLEAICGFYYRTGRKVGMKPTGGMSTARQSVQYLVVPREAHGQGRLSPDLFRISVSRLANDILMQLVKQQHACQ
jgi:deoxyribose-phosphate aldolase